MTGARLGMTYRVGELHAAWRLSPVANGRSISSWCDADARLDLALYDLKDGPSRRLRFSVSQVSGGLLLLMTVTQAAIQFPDDKIEVRYLVSAKELSHNLRDAMRNRSREVWERNARLAEYCVTHFGSEQAFYAYCLKAIAACHRPSGPASMLGDIADVVTFVDVQSESGGEYGTN